MSTFYVLGVDQSTQGTKGVLTDDKGMIIGRCDRPHRQIINDEGWVSHDPQEFFENTLAVCKEVIEKTGIDKSMIKCMGITNQRETSVTWSKKDGKPLTNAIVWQCARATRLCEAVNEKYHCEDIIYERTGLKLSPYYPAAKISWMIKNVPEVAAAKEAGDLAVGTVDSYLVYRLTEGREHRTDFSNASRTQLFNLKTLKWDEDICGYFDIPLSVLPEVTDSDGMFGETTLGGYLENAIPICGVLGDSHGALFGHNCRQPGGIKTTYGTGSSIMLNIGNDFKLSEHGLSTSLAWKANGKVFYVLEGNINYTGFVITWLKDDVKLIQTPGETGTLAEQANPQDTTYVIPAFTGLGAPWWKNDARAMIYGMSRNTGKNEIVKAAVESIAYQIRDVVDAMRKDTGLAIDRLCVDGGPTKNTYLMQFQSDIANAAINIPDAEELSVLGAIFMAGISAGVYDPETIYNSISYKYYEPEMSELVREQKVDGWKEAIGKLLN